MMSDKRIKVIKQTERNAEQPDSANKKPIAGRKHPEERDAVAIVSEWVREVRRKKVEEALQGFAGLFEEAA